MFCGNLYYELQELIKLCRKRRIPHTGMGINLKGGILCIRILTRIFTLEKKEKKRAPR
ncbi:MAG TPA: hypothetical protein VKZ62_00205 [Georgenia sp.]|nr:hypothetical protein [Georgenia sp.]